MIVCCICFAVTFAVLQPGLRQQQQQQQQMPDYGVTASRYVDSTSSSSSRIRSIRDIRTRFVGASNRRMGMVLVSPANDSSASSSAAVADDQRRRHLRRTRPRDMSCDPSLIRGLPRHDCSSTRIYDHVARDDLYCDRDDYYDPRRAGPADLVPLGHYDRYAKVRNDSPSSSPQQQQQQKPRYCSNTSFSSLNRFSYNLCYF